MQTRSHVHDEYKIMVSCFPTYYSNDSAIGPDRFEKYRLDFIRQFYTSVAYSRRIIRRPFFRLLEHLKVRKDFPRFFTHVHDSYCLAHFYLPFPLLGPRAHHSSIGVIEVHFIQIDFRCLRHNIIVVLSRIQFYVYIRKSDLVKMRK